MTILKERGVISRFPPVPLLKVRTTISLVMQYQTQDSEGNEWLQRKERSPNRVGTSFFS